METFNETMTDLLIEQDEFMDVRGNMQGALFVFKALKAERIILDGAEGATDVNKN